MAGNNSLIKQLQERGLIAQVTDKKALEKKLIQGSINLYCGFDPTAESLHLGHLIPLICLKRFQDCGHKPIALVGGATGMIGDPSFKATERTFTNKNIINNWTEKIKQQIIPFLNFTCGSNSAIIVNNYDWFASMKAITFLRDIGKYFSVNQMINKDAIKQRLKRDQKGISFTEFSYNLLQSYDFSYLNNRLNVVLQIGGSDQWGNIVSGIDLTRRLNRQQVFGLTVPLITKADGKKFGKTEDGTIWLDANKTSPYKFYQFWLNIADADVYRFLKLFTFINIQYIYELEKEDKILNRVAHAQHILAEHVTSLVHGEKKLIAVKRISRCLFLNSLRELTEEDLSQLSLDGMPSIDLDKGQDLQQALINAQLTTSRSQGRKLIEAKAISINGELQTNIRYSFKDTDRLYGRYTLLRRGKKNYSLIRWQ